jgi:hypothetical protein
MSRLRCSLVFSISQRALRCSPRCFQHPRAYASGSRTPSNLLGHQLDRRLGKDASQSIPPASVGPFPSQPLNLRGSREIPVKPWNQLTKGGKGVGLHFDAVGTQTKTLEHSPPNNRKSIESHSHYFRSYAFCGACLRTRY